MLRCSLMMSNTKLMASSSSLLVKLCRMSPDVSKPEASSTIVGNLPLGSLIISSTTVILVQSQFYNQFITSNQYIYQYESEDH